MVHWPSFKSSLYHRDSNATTKLPVHGLNVITGTALAGFGGALIPVAPASATVAITLGALINSHASYSITVAYNRRTGRF